MPALTTEERRGGLLVVLLLLIGAGWDVWRAVQVPRPPHVVGVSATAVQDATPVAAPDSSRAAPDSGHTLDLNRADARELDALPGIGPVLAARILEHRQRHGPFHSVDELRAVRGVGPRLLEKLRPRVHAGS